MNQQSLAPWAYQLPEMLDADLEEFRCQVAQLKAREISEAQFRAFRVPMGVYEQRESGTYMLRVRFPAGGVLPHQMRCLADVSTRYGNGILHVTTRQDIQVHRVPLEHLHPALLTLREAGLATKGGGGNTVRNVTACQDSGVCPQEVFDVAPYAVAVTERLMEDPISFALPRKYKIGFSACSQDCAGATVSDVGFIARQQDGVNGFAVYVGGGMGAKSRVANELHAFVPAAEAFVVSEAVKRVFDKNGDRKNKHQARLRFLVERIGFDAFRTLYRKELTALRATGPAPLVPRPYPQRPAIAASEAAPPPQGATAVYTRWQRSHVKPQKQPGFFLVEIPLPLGDLAAEKMKALADVVEAYGEKMLCATQAQNLAMRWITAAELPSLYEKLATLELATAQAPVLRNLVACAGASTCRLGICLSRGLATAVTQALQQDGLDLNNLGDLKIFISGCGNACGRHPVGDIGFSGAARRVQGRLVPHYTLHLGGQIAEGATRLGANTGTIPARLVPAFLKEYLAVFAESPQAPDFHWFLKKGGRQFAEDLAARYQHDLSFDADNKLDYDWGAATPYSLAGRGPGECSAGVFDLIEVDLAGAQAALDAGQHYAASALAARSLLITRGVQPKSDREAFDLFQQHFVNEGLLDRQLESVVASGARSASVPDPARSFDGQPADVAALVAAVHTLYQQMDASLRFKPVTAEKPSEPPSASASDIVHDFRGVACPLNYVKTKMALGQLVPGQCLVVLLDGDGAKNVPDSAARDGHKVMSMIDQGTHWRLTLRKG